MKIRDFIYLDIERLKSIIAQIEQGFVDTTNKSISSSEESSFQIEAGISNILKASDASKFLWQNQESETKSLHDYIYNKVENTLLKNNLLYLLQQNSTSQNSDDIKFRENIYDTSFILARGKITINDFTKIRAIVEKYNDLANFIAYCATTSIPISGNSKQNFNQRLAEAKKGITIDSKLHEGLKLIFDLFYKDRVIVKMLPFPDLVNFRLVGNLNSKFLREDITSIIYKYGTAPISEWYIFGQIASIPTSERSNILQTITGSQIEGALQNVFDAFRQIELLAQTVVYPEIAVTPIAIYRE